MTVTTRISKICVPRAAHGALTIIIVPYSPSSALRFADASFFRHAAGKMALIPAASKPLRMLPRYPQAALPEHMEDVPVVSVPAPHALLAAEAA